MTRTEYANKLRDAGFSVRPMWQGKTEDPQGPLFDLTCYAVHSKAGDLITHMILRDLDGGIDVFFSSPAIRVSDDIATLRRMADAAEDARHDRENEEARRAFAAVTTSLPCDPAAHPMSGRAGEY